LALNALQGQNVQYAKELTVCETVFNFIFNLQCDTCDF